MAGEPLTLGVEEIDRGPARDAGSWSLVKLELLAHYYPKFALACHKKAPAWYCVDAFAGPGVNRIKTSGELVYGSPLLALRTEPAFGKVVMMDLDKANVAALSERTERYGDRAVVKRGDCNEDLLPLMEKELDQAGPCLAILDPEGSELEWSTVEGIARFRKGKTKAEQLILFADNMGWVRELRTTGEIPIDVGERMERYFGNSEWANIWSRRVDGEIEPAEAVDQYLHLYANGLRRLGYKTVLDARVRRYGDKGQPLYTLIFATDHEAGRKIMDQILDIVTRNPTQPTLFTRARERRLD